MLLKQFEFIKKSAKDGVKISKQQLSKLVNSGRLTVDSNGLLDYDQGLQVIKEMREMPKAATPSKRYTLAHALKEESLAKSAQHDAERKAREEKIASGMWVKLSVVKDTLRSRARTVRDSLLNIPPRTSAILAAMTDRFAIEQLLNKEIHQALEELTSAADVLWQNTEEVVAGEKESNPKLN